MSYGQYNISCCLSSLATSNLIFLKREKYKGIMKRKVKGKSTIKKWQNLPLEVSYVQVVEWVHTNWEMTKL